MNFLGVPLGYAIYYIYKLIPNYAVSIIVFTVILRFIMLPMAIKQQKSLAKTSAYQPYINEINKKFSKNPAKRNEELQKFYKNHNINPAAGCLPMFLPLIILFGMMDVIYRPLTHILHIPQQTIDSAMEIFKNTTSVALNSRKAAMSMQLNLINDLLKTPEKYSILGSDVVESIKTIDLNFLGFNIGEISKIDSLTIIFPILALIFSFVQILVSFKTNSMPETNSGSPSFKIIMLAMPIFSVWISLTVPIGVSLYWIVGYVLQIVQSLVLNRICNVKQLKEEIVAEIEAVRKRKKQKKYQQNSETDSERLKKAREIMLKKYDE